MKIKIKRLHPNSVIPRYAKHGDAGMDLTATSKYYDENNNVVYGTGLAVEIPEGYVGLVFPRSSICKKDLFLTNSVGVIDSGYRGEIMAKFKHTDNLPVEYRVGERIAQLIIIPHPYIEFELANELSESERGSGGYGSSGR
jgi:dUTP pyrophosphatase